MPKTGIKKVGCRGKRWTLGCFEGKVWVVFSGETEITMGFVGDEGRDGDWVFTEERFG